MNDASRPARLFSPGTKAITAGGQSRHTALPRIQLLSYTTMPAIIVYFLSVQDPRPATPPVILANLPNDEIPVAGHIALVDPHPAGAESLE